jgi:hypothetical protein
VRHEQVDDLVLAERVRATLGRVVSHPHAIQVVSSGGFVVLRGPILEREAEPLLSAARHVRGVREVIDQLERHEQAGTVPSLQGGRAPAGIRPDVLRHHWSPATG